MFWIAYGLFGFIENLFKVPKTSSLNSIGMVLAVRGKPLGDSGQTKAIGIARFLATRVVPSSDYYHTTNSEGV